MNYQQKDWLGSWQNFESYIGSTAPAMRQAWTDAEKAAAAMPMFKAGVKTFWQQACSTTVAGPVLGGWQVEAANAQDLCITWLDEHSQPLDMAPMPERTAREHGGLLSHLHFQYAASWTALIGADGKLSHPMWYPTMCDGSGTLLEQCNILRAMHHLPCWAELPV